MIPFVKMHGCGNDFVLVREADLPPAAALDPAQLARRVCERHFGIGADGLLVYGPRPSQPGPPHLRMRYWNSDGSHAEMCGNGARCVVRLAVERGEIGSPLVLETDAGEHRAGVESEAGRVARVHIAMGHAAWDPARVPVTASLPVIESPVRLDGEELRVSALSVGNPHAVVFVTHLEELRAVPLEKIGRALAEHPMFPQGANASFVAESGGALHVRVWERGAGATLACGTASCAALAAAAFLGRVPAPRATVHLPGGRVEVWQENDGELWLAGPAAYIAEGTLAPELLQSDA